MHLFLRDGTMLDALWHNVQLPRPKRHRSISKLNVEHALQDEKKVIGVVMFVPTNSPFNFATMTSQLLNRATVRGEKCSENVASFSDKSMLSRMGPSDIVS
jgi:hypothetical protein